MILPEYLPALIVCYSQKELEYAIKVINSEMGYSVYEGGMCRRMWNYVESARYPDITLWITSDGRRGEFCYSDWYREDDRIRARAGCESRVNLLHPEVNFVSIDEYLSVASDNYCNVPTSLDVPEELL